MNKVTIEITSDGWETTVSLDGKTFVEKHKKARFGSESFGGVLEDCEEVPENLTDSFHGFGYDTMKALSEIERE